MRFVPFPFLSVVRVAGFFAAVLGIAAVAISATSSVCSYATMAKRSAAATEAWCDFAEFTRFLTVFQNRVNPAIAR